MSRPADILMLNISSSYHLSYYRLSMIVTGIFGVIVIAINIFFVVDTIATSSTTLHWGVILAIAVVGLAYFGFIFYLAEIWMVHK